MENPLVGVAISAENELPYMEECERILMGFGIPYEMRVLSVHQNLDRVVEWARGAQGRGIQVLIVGAGLAAPLASVIASQTLLPVVAVPLPTSSMQGLDALLGLAQSNVGAPIATMAVGKIGAANAGIFATQLLALKFPENLLEPLQSFRAGMAQQCDSKDQALYQDRQQRRS
jgi:5-(carboxyamino)imidazole ribonucleotide mutase